MAFRVRRPPARRAGSQRAFKPCSRRCVGLSRTAPFWQLDLRMPM